MPSRSLLTPRDAKLLVRYLDAVDSVVSARLTVGFSPHEDHLTALLCELLDGNLASLHRLDYTFDDLRRDIAADSRLLSVDFSIETRRYPPHIESRVTSSDLGVIVEYRDHIGDGESFTSGALFQAKRLYPRSLGQPFTLEDTFKEFDLDQLQRLTALQGTAHREGPRDMPGSAEGWCFYLFYCPRAESYDDNSRERARRLALPNDNIFDYSMGWHLYEFASNPERQIPGLVVSQLSWLAELARTEPSVSRQPRSTKLPTAAAVFQRLWGETHPFSWFLVYHLLTRRAGTTSDSALSIIRGHPDQSAEAPTLPRYVLTVRVQLGQG